MRTVVSLLVAAILAAPAFAQPGRLQTILTTAAKEFPGTAGIWVKHLTTGETAGVREGRSYWLGEITARATGQMLEAIEKKTGDFPPVLANDVGIIYARSGPIVVSFLGNAITGNYGEAEDRIGRLAQQVVEHFDR